MNRIDICKDTTFDTISQRLCFTTLRSVSTNIERAKEIRARLLDEGTEIGGRKWQRSLEIHRIDTVAWQVRTNRWFIRVVSSSLMKHELGMNVLGIQWQQCATNDLLYKCGHLINAFSEWNGYSLRNQRQEVCFLPAINSVSTVASIGGSCMETWNYNTSFETTHSL